MSLYLVMSSHIYAVNGKVSTPFGGHVEQFMSYLMGISGGGKDNTAAKNIKQDICKFFATLSMYILNAGP